MNPQIINSTNSVTTSTKRKREAERSMNWTVEETQVLLCAWSDQRVQKSLAENLRNRHVFKHLSARMSDMGFARSPHQCRLRVKTLKANYVRARVLKSVDGAQPCSFRYYAEMDAVLGRKATEGMGGGGGGGGVCLLGSATESGGHHLGFLEEPEGGHFDDSVDETVRGVIGSAMGAGGRLLGHLGHLGAEIKVEEDRDASTDEFEFSTAGFTHILGPRRQRVILRDSLIPPRPLGAQVEDDLSSEDPSPLPPPQPASPVPPSPPLDPDPDLGAAPTDNNNNINSGGGAPPQSQPRSLEPALKHLADCFQSLVSESRRLLVQLEGQRQEQGRWHRELLAQWLEREEHRQREAADREERRERARMEHEIRVLRLLTGLAQRTPPTTPPTPRPGCRCSGEEPTGEASANQGRENKEEEDEDGDGGKSTAL